jgi:hypothetical protein
MVVGEMGKWRDVVMEEWSYGRLGVEQLSK